MSTLTTVLAILSTSLCSPAITKYDTANTLVLESSHAIYAPDETELEKVSHRIECIFKEDAYHYADDDYECVMYGDDFLSVSDGELSFGEDNVDVVGIATDDVATAKYLLQYLTENDENVIVTRDDKNSKSLYLNSAENFPIESNFPDADKFLLQYIESDSRVTLVYEITYSESSTISKECYRYVTSFDTLDVIPMPLVLLQNLLTN